MKTDLLWGPYHFIHLNNKGQGGPYSAPEIPLNYPLSSYLLGIIADGKIQNA